jgi:peptidylprolyl isomerase
MTDLRTGAHPLHTSNRLPRSRLAPLAALAVLLLALGLAACDSDDDDSGSGSDGSAGGGGQQTELVTETAPAPDLTDTRVKPVIGQPTGSPPRKLVEEEIVKGRGPGARTGDTVVVHYVGVNFSNGEEFGASWDAGRPLQVRLGAGEVIEGWEKGLVGIKKGGRRRLTIPPEQAYGPAGAPPSIGPNETLVLVIDALEVR